MNEQTVHIPVGQMRPGDLLFLYGGGLVALCIASGHVIHAPHTGDVVKISALSYMARITAVGRSG